MAIVGHAIQMLQCELDTQTRFYCATACRYRNSVHLSVCLSVRRVYCDKTKSNHGLRIFFVPHDTAITVVFWHQQWLVGNAPFPLKSVLKVTHPLKKRRLWQISAHNVSTIEDSEKCPIMTNRNSTTGFQTSYTWSAYVTPKSPKRWLKERFFRSLSKSQRLIVSGAVNLVRRWVS